MVKLSKEDIQTTEVCDWKGLHLLHFAGSSCSQKTRIFLNLKGIEWTSRHVDLTQGENLTPWFMGINPRGLVPVLVDDGDVIIESNDILVYLEKKFPEPKLIPAGQEEETRALLKTEDDLHLDLRAISMRYLFGPRAMRTEEQQAIYANTGSGTINGASDTHKDVEAQFFSDLATNKGVTDTQIVKAASQFRSAFDAFDNRLGSHSYLLGEAVSVIDIAWYIYAVRLINAGYPLRRLHKNVGAWFDKLDARSEFHREVAMPPPLIAARDALHAEQECQGDSLVAVAGL